MKRKKVWVLLSLCIVVLFVFCSYDSEKLDSVIANRVQSEIESYQENANADGTVDIDINIKPYFITKQEGVKYKKSKKIKYYSNVTGTYRKANVILPADYDESKEYPVLYLLHGLGGSHNTWLHKSADVIIQNLNYFEDVPEMIIVLPNCVVNEDSSTDGLSLLEIEKCYDKAEEEIVDNLMPYINSHYSVKTGKENTAICGDSMGGRNALAIAFKHQDLFGYVGAFSPAHVIDDSESTCVFSPLLDDFTIDDQYGGFKEVFISVGKTDRIVGVESYIIDKRLTKNNIDHIFYESGGCHRTDAWQRAFYNFAKTLFK